MAATKESSEPKTFEIGPHLGVNQIHSLKTSLDQEIQLLQESLQSLKMAQQKFQESGECLENIKPENDGQDVLVPLTGSMYVPGKISNPDNVLINIGTGYYVEMDLVQARDYFKRKVKFMTEQMEKIQEIGIEKSRISTALEDMLMKMVAQQQPPPAPADATAAAKS